jgi:antitoxin VapB
MPGLNVKDPEVYSMAAELARLTGKSMTFVVKHALREQLVRERRQEPANKRTVNRVMALARRIAARPVLDSRTPDEILGYDESGVPR